MLEVINYLHAKFQINILKNKNVIKHLEVWQFWMMNRRRNSEYRVVFTKTGGGRSVIISSKCGNLHFHAPIGVLVL